MKELVAKSWEEFKLLEEEDEIDLKMTPSVEKKSVLSRLIPTSTSKLKIAFIYAKTSASSAWTYSHELGRLYLEETFPEEVSTVVYENATQENIDLYLETAIKGRVQYYPDNNAGVCKSECKSGDCKSGGADSELLFEYVSPLHQDILCADA